MISAVDEVASEVALDSLSDWLVVDALSVPISRLAAEVSVFEVRVSVTIDGLEEVEMPESEV